MVRRFATSALALASLSLVILTVPVCAATERWQAGTSLLIASGKYGTDTNTTSMYWPFMLDRLFERARVGLTLPFVSVTSDQEVSLVGGKPQKLGRIREGTTANDKTSESGLGDILLRGQFVAIEEQEMWPETTLTGRIKFPTADEDRGLGTGEFDESVGVEFWKTVTGPWSALASLGFTHNGDPADRDLNNTWAYSVGGGYSFRSDLLGTLSLENSRAVAPGDKNPLDVIFGVSYSGYKTFNFNGSVQFGLSNGSPDVGVGMGMSYRFDHFPHMVD